MSPTFLSLQEVMWIHQDQLHRYGGDAGLRDLDALRSAVGMPKAGAQGVYYHSDLFEMASAYLYHLVQNHAFIDGNKRVGTASAVVFLDLNGIELRVDDAALVDMVIQVASGKAAKSDVADFFRTHARKV